MRRAKYHRPFQIYLIAGFQILKADILLTLAAYLRFAPDRLPDSAEFSQLLFVAAHGKNVSGILVPLFGLYLLYTGVQLLRLRRNTRRSLAISSAITVALSLQRLGLFGGDNQVHDPSQREAFYILILLDLAVYIYLAFHPEITQTFER